MAGPSARETLRVGTRGSQLALWQADHVVARLRAGHPGLGVERVVVRTLGDKRPEAALAAIGGRGIFTREIEDALRKGSIDVAVHSLKDLPTGIAEGLELGAVLPREDPRDALVSRVAQSLPALPPGARIGTSSLRRRAQLLALRADLKVLDLRGNVPTRIQKLERGECDAIVLARAGLLRLGLEGRIAEVFEPEALLPAVGQGAIAAQIRAGEPGVAGLLAALDHEPTRLATAAERALLARLEGGCQVPVAALGTLAGRHLTLRALVADVDGREVVRDSEARDVGGEAEARALGEALAERLLEQGAAPILARVRALGYAGPAGFEA
ncbi:MAG TPA: hydroxymethylbilane synthase [Vicinamibacteria bacterium]|nr:hydroxymethylbilane synthase [Vicinamibacteria bacterium]